MCVCIAQTCHILSPLRASPQSSARLQPTPSEHSTTSTVAAADAIMSKLPPESGGVVPTSPLSSSDASARNIPLSPAAVDGLLHNVSLVSPKVKALPPWKKEAGVTIASIRKASLTGSPLADSTRSKLKAAFSDTMHSKLSVRCLFFIILAGNSMMG
jgi:hypothetical protein